MTSSLLDGLNQQLQGSTLTQLSHQLGTDQTTTANAVSVALPMLVGGLANNASQPAGAQALSATLDRHHDGSVLGNLPALFGSLGGATQAHGALNGTAILGHILGARQGSVEQGIGRATGLSGGQTTRLLAMLAPIVMAYLGRQKRERQLDANGLGTALHEERKEIERRAPGAGGLLGQLFDRNHDGNVADDIARAAPGMFGGLFGR